MYRYFHGLLEETIHGVVDGWSFFADPIFNHTSTPSIGSREF
jgi:hypothetical protein